MTGGSNANRSRGKGGSGGYRFEREKASLDKLRAERGKDEPFPLSPDEEDSLKVSRAERAGFHKR